MQLNGKINIINVVLKLHFILDIVLLNLYFQRLSLANPYI